MALLVIAIAVGALLACRASESEPAKKAGDAAIPVVVWEAEGFRYEYHVPTGSECLFDATEAPRRRTNVIRQHRDRARTYRQALEAKLGVANLEELRAPYADEIRRLEALGYL